MPKFTVVIPLYNKEREIYKTLESVLKQTFIDYEVIIIDDGSTDKSLVVAQQFTDNRIKIIKNPNEGVARTRNIGIALSNAPFIAFLDADDLWFPNHLEIINRLIIDFPQHHWFAASYLKQFSESHLVKMFSPLFNTNFNRGPVVDFFANSTVDCLAWTSAVVMEKAFIENIGHFDSKITHGAGEDSDLWIRAALRSPLVFTKEITAIHKMDAENRISNTKIQLRNFINLDSYNEEAKANLSLKKYLDVFRFSIAIQYKIAGDLKTFKWYHQKIDLKNLNKKQILILKLPVKMLIQLLNFKKMLQNKGIYLTAFK